MELLNRRQDVLKVLDTSTNHAIRVCIFVLNLSFFSRVVVIFRVFFYLFFFSHLPA